MLLVGDVRDEVHIFVYSLAWLAWLQDHPQGSAREAGQAALRHADEAARYYRPLPDEHA